jgi:hypothetical protein
MFNPPTLSGDFAALAQVLGQGLEEQSEAECCL